MDRITEDRHGRKPPAVPTVIGLTLTLTIAAARGVPVARWDGTRHHVYRDGAELEDWSPWPR